MHLGTRDLEDPFLGHKLKFFSYKRFHFHFLKGYFTSISVDLQARRDMIVSILEEAGLPPVVPEGGYFIMADWTPFRGKIDISSESDQEADFRFAKWLSKNRKLQGIPPTAFFSGPHKSIGENYIRFCFIKVS